ncbi:MAG: DUF393 domain-containing protein [Flavobacterium sp.]|nr:DUF393 domain-containing protein [Flavobacterium sp.]
MLKLPQDKKIILFDGVCNLCESSVQFIIKHDTKDIFRFVSQQSENGIEILERLSIGNSNLESIILYEPDGTFYFKSEAGFKIAQNLDGFVSLISICRFLPKFLTDAVYNFIAKNRYKWLGKKEHCLIPTESIKNKFL